MRSWMIGVGAVCLLGLAGISQAATLPVPAGGDLQAALTKAQCGDRIELASGATFTGEFALPARACADNPIILTTAGTIPERRILPSDAPQLATIRSGQVTAALSVFKTAGWTIVGIKFDPNLFGAETLIHVQDSEAIEFDRVLMDAPDTVGQRRFILGNGKAITLRRSYCAGAWAQTKQDSQCFNAYDGAGPYTIRDNFLEAAGENVMFGGADSAAADKVPGTILVEDNYFTKRLAWKTLSQPNGGPGRAVKNLFELKQAKGAIIRRNTFENNWADAQAGWAIVLTPRNDDGNAPWAVVQDVLFEQNTIRAVERGLNILGVDSYHPSGRLTRVVIRNNTWQTQYNFWQAGGEIGELTIADNAVTNGGLWGLLYHGGIWPTAENLSGPRMTRYAVETLKLENNTGRRQAGEPNGIFGEETGYAPLAYNGPSPQHPKGHAPGAVDTNNVFTESASGPVTPPDPPVEPPTPPTSPLMVTSEATQCRFTLKQNPPDTSGGWKVQFKRNGVNFGLSDSTEPYERSSMLNAGVYQFSAVWTKKGQTTVTTTAPGECR